MTLRLVSLRPALSAETDIRSTTVAASIPSNPDYIYFHHPGYTRPVAMFRLPAYDLPSHHLPVIATAPPVTCRGIHHRTALDACCIIACNVTGFLSPVKIDRDDYTPPMRPVDAVLTGSDYWYYPSG